MKSKQLANVLIKVLGFSVCLYAIPSCVSGIVFALNQPPAHPPPDFNVNVMRVVSYGIGAAFQLAFGIAIIAMSRKISGWLFKHDDD